MKAKELMIGAYVLVRPSMMPIQVAAIHKKKVAYHATGDTLTWVRDGLIEPIPITPEILEKNGWTYNDEDEKFFPQTWVGGGLMLQSTNGGYRIVVTSDYDDEDTNSTPFLILYVHELQHALRLRRINKEIVL